MVIYYWDRIRKKITFTKQIEKFRNLKMKKKLSTEILGTFLNRNTSSRHMTFQGFFPRCQLTHLDFQVVFSTRGQMSRAKKTSYFPLNPGWLIGPLIMVYYPYITLGSIIPCIKQPTRVFSLLKWCVQPFQHRDLSRGDNQPPSDIFPSLQYTYRKLVCNKRGHDMNPTQIMHYYRQITLNYHRCVTTCIV